MSLNLMIWKYQESQETTNKYKPFNENLMKQNKKLNFIKTTIYNVDRTQN